ncbi:hypothetical protein CF65_01266 [Aggregatibacter actinomycetemcomitans HK1651]|nr:hypothetical protein CF65_01266 [Aggregatibacter actinomycetemcomitans HK1651]
MKKIALALGLTFLSILRYRAKRWRINFERERN